MRLVRLLLDGFVKHWLIGPRQRRGKEPNNDQHTVSCFPNTEKLAETHNPPSAL